MRLAIPAFLLVLLSLAWPGSPALAEDPKAPSDPSRPDEARRTAVLKVVDEIRVEAARYRGLPWKQDVPADLISRAELKTHLERMIKEELVPAEYERDVKLMRRFGLLKADEDALEMEKKFLESGILAYYDPKTKRFYMVDGISPEAQRPTILHELVHALEDQYIGLEKRQDALKDDSDGLFALKCVLEGSAEHGRSLYEKDHPEVAALMRKEQASSAAGQQQMALMRTVPLCLFLPTILHYQTGPAFVGRCVALDYPGGIAKLYDDCPRTQEQVLHSSKFLGKTRDLPRKIAFGGDLAAAAGEGWKRLKEWSDGELDTILWLDYFLGGNGGRLDLALVRQGRWWSKEAQNAAEGWDGMRAVAVEKEGLPIVVGIASAWDTPQDATEAGEAILKATRLRFGEAFQGGAWEAAAEGVRQADYATPLGLGRIRISGDTVHVLDGVPPESSRLATLWETVTGATIERDPGDTWTPGGAEDALAGAAWRNAEAGLGWKSPGEGWKTTADVAAPAAGAVFEKGDLSVRVRAEKGNLINVATQVGRQILGATGGSAAVPEESEAFGHEALRWEYEFQGPAGKIKSTVWIVPLGDWVVVVRAEALTEKWAGVQADVRAALSAFLVRD